MQLHAFDLLRNLSSDASFAVVKEFSRSPIGVHLRVAATNAFLLRGTYIMLKFFSENFKTLHPLAWIFKLLTNSR